MALDKNVLDKDTLDIIKDSFDNVKTKAGMPANVEIQRISAYTSPALVIAGEKDCLFPAKKVLPEAKKMMPNCKTYMLKSRGHMNILHKQEKQMVVDFLEREGKYIE